MQVGHVSLVLYLATLCSSAEHCLLPPTADQVAACSSLSACMLTWGLLDCRYGRTVFLTIT
jgi:hypothetical protein